MILTKYVEQLDDLRAFVEISGIQEFPEPLFFMI
jgi:hypothetical protein